MMMAIVMSIHVELSINDCGPSKRRQEPKFELQVKLKSEVEAEAEGEAEVEARARVGRPG